MIVSDNASVFKTAAKWIKLIRKSKKLQDYLASEGITWQFNLSKSPWWGGMYERLIKDIKKTLYKTLGKTLLKPEQLEAVIMDIERHLNNRPLTYVESDSGEEQVLTPNIIMWGKDSHILEELEVEEDTVSKMFRRMKNARQHVWSRWSKEYVNSLRDHSVFMVCTGPEICQMVEQKSPCPVWKMCQKILLSRMDHKLKKSLPHIGNRCNWSLHIAAGGLGVL